jgi:hypothetical protein
MLEFIQAVSEVSGRLHTYRVDREGRADMINTISGFVHN